MKTVLTKQTDKLGLVAKISDDRLKLFIDAEPAGKQAVSRADILAVLSGFGGTQDFDIGVIDDVAACLTRGEAVKERRIRKGHPPEDGTDGKIVYMVKKYTGKGELKGDQEEWVDLADIHLFDNVTKGQVVARIYPPKDGKPGLDAMGGEMPARPGKPFKITMDKTLSLRGSEDSRIHFENVIAEGDGYLREERGRLGVQERLIVCEDLDYRYGNIDFIGSVLVTGDVLPGFSLVARRDIVVNGSVMGGSLTSIEGDIVLKGGAFGGRGSKIVCGGSLTALAMHEVEAEVRGVITVLREATDCLLRSSEVVSMADGKLIGGEAYVVCGLEAREIGNELGASTAIHLCNTVEATAEYGALVTSIASHEKAIHLLELHLGPLAAKGARLDHLHEPHRSKMRALIDKLRGVRASRARLLDKKKRMLESARMNDTARVNFLEKMFFGVAVVAGEDVFENKDELPGPASLDYFAAERRFALGEKKALECTYAKLDNGRGKDERTKDE